MNDFFRLINAYGIPTLESINVNDNEEAIRAANKMGYPVVVKILSDDISHKTDAGGVKLNIMNDEELNTEINKMIYNISTDYPQCHIEGVTIQKQAPPDGVEMIVGVTNDPQFGHVVMFGLGGIYAEVLNDVTFKVVPFHESTALRMIGEIDSYKLLRGFRGTKPVDLQSITEVIMKLQTIVKYNPEIQELDINPLICYHNGCVAVDGRMF